MLALHQQAGTLQVQRVQMALLEPAGTQPAAGNEGGIPGSQSPVPQAGNVAMQVHVDVGTCEADGAAVQDLVQLQDFKTACFAFHISTLALKQVCSWCKQCRPPSPSRWTSGFCSSHGMCSWRGVSQNNHGLCKA